MYSIKFNFTEEITSKEWKLDRYVLSNFYGFTHTVYPGTWVRYR